MELIYLAIVLFIVGVAGTMIYDKHKDSLASKLKEATTPKPKPVRAAKTVDTSGLDNLLNEVKARQQRGQRTVNVQQGTKYQTMDVQELIKQLEQMKKRL